MCASLSIFIVVSLVLSVLERGGERGVYVFGMLDERGAHRARRSPLQISCLAPNVISFCRVHDIRDKVSTLRVLFGLLCAVYVSFPTIKLGQVCEMAM